MIASSENKFYPGVSNMIHDNLGGNYLMNYKKLVSLLAVSTFALAACDTDEEPSPEPEIEEGVDDTNDVDDTTDEEVDTDDGAEDTEDDAGDGQSAHDIIDNIEGSDLGYTSDVELEITGGVWTQDGYTFTPAANDDGDVEATVNGSTGNPDAFAYVIQEGEVIDTPEMGEDGTFSYTVPSADADQEFQVGVSDEDLWEVGDEADVEQLDRYENVIILAPTE